MQKYTQIDHNIVPWAASIKPSVYLHSMQNKAFVYSPQEQGRKTFLAQTFEN